MDELKIKSGFLKFILKRLILSKMKKKFGDYITDLSIGDVEVTMDDDEMNIHLEVSGKAKKEFLSEVLMKNM